MTLQSTDITANANTLLLHKTVRKRDGVTLQPFTLLKIADAIRNAWQETMEPIDEALLTQIVDAVTPALGSSVIDVESIQDAVEVALMRYHKFAVAKAYILYRQKRTEARNALVPPDATALAGYIHASKYARYLPEQQRREVYAETVARVEAMHQRRFAHIPEMAALITKAFALVHDKRVLPSMRSMQFAGASIEKVNNRIYNCSATLVDRPRVFAEALYLLLAGCGVGYSVQIEHVEKLPTLVDIDPQKVIHHIVADTIQGWAEALEALVNSYLTGHAIEFSYHLIRPAGAPLKLSGGRAPGHTQLRIALERIRQVLHSAQGRKLRPVECHRMLCHAADAVLSGGIRRSAMICLFSLEDSELMHCKTSRAWFREEPWLANANNSVVLKRDDVKEAQFKRIFAMTRNYGEPGVLFVSDYSHVTNPCSEIGLDPVLVADDGTLTTGWAMCNLCEINGARLTSLADFEEAAWAATLIGTLQATYTAMPFLGATTEAIVRRDALLGIGITGMQDAPAIACNPQYQQTVAKHIVGWNALFAAMLGINAAARTTCIKPSGTTSLALNSVGSGIHPHHARRYIRRVTADALETVFQAFQATNPHMCVRKPDGKWVIEFPVEAPAGATLRRDLDAATFMEMVRSTQQHWVVPGTARASRIPGAVHNVSNTITVKDQEWGAVADYLWAHRDDFTGVSLLPDTGDTLYAFAPFEEITTDAQQRRWQELAQHYKPVDYLALFEAVDGTSLKGEVACAGGACAIA